MCGRQLQAAIHSARSTPTNLRMKARSVQCCESIFDSLHIATQDHPLNCAPGTAFANAQAQQMKDDSSGRTREYATELSD